MRDAILRTPEPDQAVVANRAMEAAFAISRMVARSRSLDDVCATVLDAARSVVGADRAALVLLDGDGVMRFHAWQNLSDAYRARTTGHSPWPADLATEPEPELIPDVAGDARLDALRDVVIEEGIRALAFVPLFDDGRLIGKLMLYYDTVHTLLPLELIVARMLATQASFAIGRLRAQQRAEDAHAELMYWPSVIRTLGSEV